MGILLTANQRISHFFYFISSDLLFLRSENWRLVAQLVEHVTLNHGVVGSIPTEPTRLLEIIVKVICTFFAQIAFFHFIGFEVFAHNITIIEPQLIIH